MDTVFLFLNQPIIITLLSLAIGGYFLDVISDRRAKKAIIREKSIDLISEVGNNFNSVVSRIFGHIRTGNLKVKQDNKLKDRIGILFTNRLNVMVKSKAYLRSKDFAHKYETLVFELNDIYEYMDKLSKDLGRENTISEILIHIQTLSNAWPLENENIFTNNVEPEYKELADWATMVSKRVRWLLSSYLTRVLK